MFIYHAKYFSKIFTSLKLQVMKAESRTKSKSASKEHIAVLMDMTFYDRRKLVMSGASLQEVTKSFPLIQRKYQVRFSDS